MRKRKEYPNKFDEYISKLDDSLNKYQLTYIEKEEPTENNSLSATKYISKDDKNLIKKIYNSNKIEQRRGLSSKNEDYKLKVIISEKNYPNPYKSLGVIKNNNHIFNEISKDILYWQTNLFNKQILNSL